MAELNIKISDCGISYYRYYLKGYRMQYIPVIVVKLPYTKSQLSNYNYAYVTVDGKADVTEVVYANVYGLTSGLPYWQYQLGNNMSAFLEVYQDDLIHMSSNITNNTFKTTFSMYLNGTLLESNILNTLNSSTEYMIDCHIIIYQTLDNIYINSQGLLRNNLGSSTNSARGSSVISFPSDQIKGVYNPKSYHWIVWTRLSYEDFTYTHSNADIWIARILAKSKKIDENDPNTTSGDSSGGGGGGSGDIGGDEHEGGTTPTITALDSGLITLYNPTVAELQSLGKFLWSDSFDVNTFKKLFNDPFDTLLGLSIVPIKPNVSGTHNIIFGNLDSGVSSSIIANQWVSFDCGSLTLNETWNGALDYAPWTQVSIYLPFIGVKQLNVNDVMGSVLHLTYQIDVLSGACIAEISINHSAQGNKSSGLSYNANMGTVYTFEGQCSTNIPLASSDFTNTIRAAISGVSVASSAAVSCATGRPVLGMATLAVGMANTGIQAETPTVERSGQLSGSNSIMASLQPCLFVSRPHICKPEKYYSLRGIPSQVYVSDLSKCTGFFQIADVQNIHASGATDSELDEIKNMLTQGVFVEKWATKTIEKENTLKLTLYNNKSAKNKIDKNITAIRDDNIVEGTFRDSCNIENPVIRVKINNVTTLNNLNYMFIGMFQRYYYITNITSMRNHIIEITGHVDPLMTYAYEISQNTAIIARSSQVPAYGNTYLDDNLLATYQDTYNVAYNFPNKFSHNNDNLILAVAGALNS